MTSFMLPKTREGLFMLAINRIPAGYTVYPTGEGSDVANATYIGGPELKLDATNTSMRFQFLDNFFAIGGSAIWEGASIDDYISAQLIAPASTGMTNQAGDFTKIPDAYGGNIIVPVAPGTGDWDVDLTAKHPGTEILKNVPVPAPGKDGFFDYDIDSNTYTVNYTQTGSHFIFDHDMPLFRFCHKCWGKADGAESNLESSDVIGKLLCNGWVIEFTLHAANPSAKAAIELKTAVKANI